MGNKADTEKKVSFESFAMDTKCERSLVEEINRKFKVGDMIIAEFNFLPPKKGIFLGTYKKYALFHLALYVRDKPVDVMLSYNLKFLSGI